MIFDLVLIVLFFIAFKFYGIYVATGVIIVGAILQVIITRLRHKKFDKKQLILLGVVLLFGGSTLYFHDPIFIKWKPTVVFWLMGIALLFSQFIGKQPLIQRLMGHVFEGKETIPSHVWKNLNIAWMLFFILMGTVNIIIAYCLSTDAWVNFKLYGVFSALIIFAVAQSFYLARYFTVNK